MKGGQNDCEGEMRRRRRKGRFVADQKLSPTDEDAHRSRRTQPIYVGPFWLVKKYSITVPQDHKENGWVDSRANFTSYELREQGDLSEPHSRGRRAIRPNSGQRAEFSGRFLAVAGMARAKVAAKSFAV